LILIPIVAVILALVLDLSFGDPTNRYHPTVWMGRLIGKFVPHTRSVNSLIEKINGTTLLILMIVMVSILIFSFTYSKICRKL